MASTFCPNRYKSLCAKGGSFLAFVVTCLIATHVTAQSSIAGAFYTDVQGGISQFRSPEAFFGIEDGAGVSDLGLAFNIGLFKSFSNSPKMDFQLGLQYRFDSVTQGAYNMATHAPYLLARIQVMALYVSGGISPLMYKRFSGAPGLIDGLTPATGALGLMGEAGLLWSVTPRFSLGAAAAAQWVTVNGSASPAPIINILGSMRFYYGFSNESGSGGRRTPLEYEGWRYIGGQ